MRLGNFAPNDMEVFFKPSSILPEKICQFKFFPIQNLTRHFYRWDAKKRNPRTTSINTINLTIKNNTLNDFVSFALPAHWHRHLKLCLGLNFQLISFPIARVLMSSILKKDM